MHACRPAFAALSFLPLVLACAGPRTRPETARPAPAGLLDDQDGLVALELETLALPADGAWVAERDPKLAPFSGTGYLRATVDERKPHRGVLTLRVNLSTAGEWRLRIRGRHDHPRFDLENDLFLRVDDGPWLKFWVGKPSGHWVWSGSAHTLDTDHTQKTPLAGTLAAGPHTITIAARSAHFKIDKLVLYRPEREAVALTPAGAQPASGRAIWVQDGRFFLDKASFELWGIRVAGAAGSEARTEALLGRLDEYRAHGVTALAVDYMADGTDPFSPDGSSVDPALQARLERILRAADERQMVVVVGLFSPGVQRPRLRDWAAAREAARTVTRLLGRDRNVILDLAGEQDARGHAGTPWERVRQVEDLRALAGLIHQLDPLRVVGAGGRDHGNNERLARAQEIDVLLFATAPDASPRALHDRFVAAGVRGKPLVGLASAGGWTGRSGPAGVFSEAVKRRHLEEVQAAAELPALHLVFHDPAWLQATAGARGAYELGGDGSPARPGIRWYFERVKAHQERTAAAAGAR